MIFETPGHFDSSDIAPSIPSEDAFLFLIRGDEIATVLAKSDILNIPRFRQITKYGLRILRPHYLGKLRETPCYAGEITKEESTSSEIHWSGLRALFGRLDDSFFSLAGRSLQIVDWDRSSLFCGRCGEKTILGEKERVKLCPKCQQRHYPKIAPAVMALVSRGDEFLLARSPHFPSGMFSALAGFTEPGETLEQTIHREVLEEVGIRINNIRYFSSQPWPFPHSMMIAFHCDYESGRITCDPNEIEDAQWFSSQKLPSRLPGKISIARSLLESKLARNESAL